MRVILSRLPVLSALVLSLLLFQPSLAGAQSATGEGNVAVLDVQRVLQEAKAMQALRQQVSAKRTEFQKEITEREQKLRADNQELAKKRAIMAPEQFADERRKFDQQVAEVQQLIQRRDQQLKKANDQALFQVQAAYNEIVVQIGEERGYALILRKSATISIDKNLEITPTVIALLDQRLPSVTLKVEN